MIVFRKNYSEPCAKKLVNLIETDESVVVYEGNDPVNISTFIIKILK